MKFDGQTPADALTTDESRIANSFTHVIPRDFQWASDGRLRESKVMRMVGRRGKGEYQWAQIDECPSLNEMAERRSRRG